jgi:molybdate transport system substrate-binding protein
MPALVEAFRDADGGEVTATFGPSGRLAAQIEAGAPVDVFLSADEGFVRSVGKDLEEATIRPYATGRLALVGVGDLEELAGESVKKIAMANPDHAPYGKAAREALRAAGLWEKVREKIVLAENVRQAQQFVESGNAEAGLVSYATARGSAGLGATPVDESLYPPLVQWLGVVKGSARPARAREFAAFMASDRARGILEAAGFKAPPDHQEAGRESQSAK